MPRPAASTEATAAFAYCCWWLRAPHPSADPRCCWPPWSVAEVPGTCGLPDAFFVALSAWFTTHIISVDEQPLLDGWEELIDEASRSSYYFDDTTNKISFERHIVAAVSAAAAVAAFHLDGGNVNATTKSEVPVEGQPLLDGWEELISEASGLSN